MGIQHSDGYSASVEAYLIVGDRRISVAKTGRDAIVIGEGADLPAGAAGKLQVIVDGHVESKSIVLKGAANEHECSVPYIELSEDGLDEQAEALIEEIREAFKKTPRGPLSIHQAMHVKDPWQYDLEAEGRKDRDQTWEEIPGAVIESAGEAFYGADAESWRYFIPAFMVWTLKNFRTNDSFVCDQTIYTFDPYSVVRDEELHKRQLYRFSLLSKRQAGAVLQFLKYMAADSCYADDVVAREAIEAYWHKFDANGVE
jgi:hypothetical protein